MQIVVRGKVVDVSTNSDGKADVAAIQQAAGIDSSRMLVRRTSDHRTEVIPKSRSVQLSYGEEFQDMPRYVRGASV